MVKHLKKISAFVAMISILGCSAQNFQTVQNQQASKSLAVYNNKVDLLWVVDSSYETMTEHQNRISNYMDVFYSDLLKTKTDFRVAATTMDMSQNGEQGALVENGLVVDKNTSQPVEALKSLIQQGGQGSSYELGLSALSNTIQKNSNQFFRDEALLVVVFITDDQDFSQGPVSNYIQDLNSFKGHNVENEQKWIANYIGVTSLDDPRCKTYGTYSSIGTRYIELAESSGGVVDTICYTDFSSYMNQITVRLKEVLNEFSLNDLPILDSITVKKNGVNIRQDKSNGWVYNADKNSILLVGSARPKPEDEVLIDYELSNIKKEQ